MIIDTVAFDSPSDPFVSMSRYECRACGEVGPLFGERGPGGAWNVDHRVASGSEHDRFYLWTATRATARVFL